MWFGFGGGGMGAPAGLTEAGVWQVYTGVPGDGHLGGQCTWEGAGCEEADSAWGFHGERQRAG